MQESFFNLNETTSVLLYNGPTSTYFVIPYYKYIIGDEHYQAQYKSVGSPNLRSRLVLFVCVCVCVCPHRNCPNYVLPIFAVHALNDSTHNATIYAVTHPCIARSTAVDGSLHPVILLQMAMTYIQWCCYRWLHTSTEVVHHC